MFVQHQFQFHTSLSIFMNLTSTQSLVSCYGFCLPASGASNCGSRVLKIRAVLGLLVEARGRHELLQSAIIHCDALRTIFAARGQHLSQAAYNNRCQFPAAFSVFSGDLLSVKSEISARGHPHWALVLFTLPPDTPRRCWRATRKCCARVYLRCKRRKWICSRARAQVTWPVTQDACDLLFQLPSVGFLLMQCTNTSFESSSLSDNSLNLLQTGFVYRIRWKK